MIGARRTIVSVLVSVALVGKAVAPTRLMASAGVFTGTEQDLPSAPVVTTSTVAAASASASAFSSAYQVAQPRDPFEPLIVDTTPTTDGGGDSTTTTAGSGDTTTTAGGSTTTTQAGGTTTTTVDDDPDGIRVVLLEVRTENGERVAVVEVDGQTYTVAVGDTFATSFRVVSLTDNGGVFTFGDSAFTLAVGQSILK